jgi:hypothetical protein
MSSKLRNAALTASYAPWQIIELQETDASEEFVIWAMTSRFQLQKFTGTKILDNFHSLHYEKAPSTTFNTAFLLVYHNHDPPCRHQSRFLEPSS